MLYMVITRSMAITEEIKNYLSTIIQPLAKQDKIDEMLNILSKLESRLIEQDKKIEILEAQVSVQEKVIENLIIKCDNNEQYSRRSCLRLNGVVKPVIMRFLFWAW